MAKKKKPPEPKTLLLEACKEYIQLFRESDMYPEDDCHELYQQMLTAVEAAEEEKQNIEKG